jgi:ATP-dependent DNA ligase
VWADCEALERRHNLGRGTLIVLDVVPESGTPSYEQRRAMLESLLPMDAVFSGDTSRAVPCGDVVLTPTLRADSHADALAFYQRLRAANRALGCDFFEGVVMKRAESIYPVQLRSATEEFRGWAKHRYLT